MLKKRFFLILVISRDICQMSMNIVEVFIQLDLNKIRVDQEIPSNHSCQEIQLRIYSLIHDKKDRQTLIAACFFIYYHYRS